MSYEDVSQQTIDECNCQEPQPSGCAFSMVPAFYEFDQGCNVFDTTAGADLGNYSGACPSDPYAQQSLCAFARQANGPERWQDDAESWQPGVDEPFDGPPFHQYPNPWDVGADPSSGMPAYVGPITEDTYGFPGDPLPNDFFTFAATGARPMSQTDFFREQEFRNANPGESRRNVLVLGSSMMSTHNQTQNGRMCSRASTRADRRGLIGNDFEASPAWSTRVPWAKALPLGRTGFSSGQVCTGANDACGNPWVAPATPIAMGLRWLANVGTTNGLVVTDGGLINDQQSVTGGWSDTLAALVACNAMDRMEGPVNITLAAEHAALNPLGIIVRGRFVAAVPPMVNFRRQMPPRMVWANALDIAPPGPYARCWYQQTPGNGINPRGTLRLLRNVDKQVPPLIRLAVGAPVGSPVPANLLTIKGTYFNNNVNGAIVNVKQIWLQYPYMDQAQVALRGSDLKHLWIGVSRWLIDRWGRNAVLRIPAIDRGSAARIRKVTDDLNELMYTTLGCPGAFVKGHAATVCARAGGAPMVVVTQDNFPGWAAGDHQDTVIGGMPHENAAGATKLGQAIVGADALP